MNTGPLKVSGENFVALLRTRKNFDRTSFSESIGFVDRIMKIYSVFILAGETVGYEKETDFHPKCYEPHFDIADEVDLSCYNYGKGFIVKIPKDFLKFNNQKSFIKILFKWNIFFILQHILMST